jgi:hypothetical protein
MKEIEMFLLMNMDSPLARDRCMKLIEKNLNERVVGELEDLIDGLDEFELHSDFPYSINKRIKELKQ